MKRLLMALLTVVALATWLGFSARQSNGITIIQITDAHVDRAEVSDYYDAFVSGDAWRKVDVVINTGDFANAIQNHTDALERIPQELVIGNHELLRSTPESLLPYGNRTISVEGYTILLVSWELPDAVDWIDSQLNIAIEPVIIAIHCPLLARCEEHRAIMEAQEDFADIMEAQYQVRELLGKYADKVVLVISGHHHQNYIAYEYGIPHLATVSLNYGYRVIRITPNKIISHFVSSGNTDFEAGFAWWMIAHNPYLSPEDTVIGFPKDRDLLHRTINRQPSNEEE